MVPFLFTKPQIKNKYGLLLSILFNKSSHTLIFKNNISATIPEPAFLPLIHLFRILRQAATWTITNDGIMTVSFDYKNNFSFDLTNLNQETKNFLDLLQGTILFGGTIITPEDNETILNEQTLKIYEKDGKRIVETFEGIKFYIENFVGGITETFVEGIHEIHDIENWDGKIVVDVGASMGDTPLYFANKGAKVYAFEISKRTYDEMIQNLELNPELKHKIIPVHAGIGKDGELTYFTETETVHDLHDSATIFSKRFKDNVKLKEMQAPGYTLKTVYEKFGIDKIDLLKMDCKGCEFTITENELKHVQKIKIEYFKYHDEHKIQDLLKILKNAGFKYRLYKHTPFEVKSFTDAGNIFAYKD
tara:strand:- start:1880 stop:2962 length:1083 start_codon:yes stop_codon:yes gene_type:complete